MELGSSLWEIAMKARQIALASVGDRHVLRPKLVHAGYATKSETQARMSHAEQVYRLLRHIEKLKGELARGSKRAAMLIAQAEDECRMHAALMPKGTVLRG